MNYSLADVDVVDALVIFLSWLFFLTVAVALTGAKRLLLTLYTKCFQPIKGYKFFCDQVRFSRHA